jgi:hypothetical protein
MKAILIAFFSSHQKNKQYPRILQNGQIKCPFFGFIAVIFGMGQACQDDKNALKWTSSR